MFLMVTRPVGKTVFVINKLYYPTFNYTGNLIWKCVNRYKRKMRYAISS